MASQEGAFAQEVRSAPGTARVARPENPLVPTVFHEPWWLDTVCPGGWDAAEVMSDGRLVAWMPYAVVRRRGFMVSVMPSLSHCMGPAVDEGNGTPASRMSRRLELLIELGSRLPRVSCFSQTCHPGLHDVLGLQCCGFDAFVQFSAEILPSTPEEAWHGMRDKARNAIRRAKEALQVETMPDAQEFIRFYRSNLDSARRRSYYDLERIPRLFEQANSRGQGRIVGARDRAGALVAAVFYVWDRSRQWYFLSTRRPEAENGAVSLLLWEGIAQAQNAGRVFDFDGIASPGSARFFSGFGGQRRSSFMVHRRTPLYGICSAVFDAMRERNHLATP